MCWPNNLTTNHKWIPILTELQMTNNNMDNGPGIILQQSFDGLRPNWPTANNNIY